LNETFPSIKTKEVAVDGKNMEERATLTSTQSQLAGAESQLEPKRGSRAAIDSSDEY